MTFDRIPFHAAWRHADARDGFEVVFMQEDREGIRFEGHTAAVEAGEPWWVAYIIQLTPAWLTQRALIRNRSAAGEHEVLIEADGLGAWQVNGRPELSLQGCLDIDLEASAVTNTFPVHRLALLVGQSADAPAAYVRALDLRVMRLEQRYERRPDSDQGHRYAYTAPAFDADFELPYDASGLVLDYPQLARRVL